MTASTYGAAMSPPETSGSGHEPVLVAMKPYEGFDSALAMARWIAAEQMRPEVLHAVAGQLAPLGHRHVLSGDREDDPLFLIEVRDEIGVEGGNRDG